jgi:hypothetical protein
VRRGIVLGLALAIAAVAAWVRLLAGGPVLPGVGGGWLRGERATALPDDWSFANRDPYLLVESDAWTLPYSTSVWFLAHEGRLHLLLPSFFGDGLQRRIADDPRLRVAVDGKLYDQVAEPVVGDAALAALLGPVIRRQFAVELGDGATALPPGGGKADVAMAMFKLVDPR